MATGREGRENRLNQRLRGAQRVNVGDDISFSFDLAGVPPARSSSSPAVTAQTPAARSQSAVADVSSAGNSDLTPRGPSPNASASDGGRSGPSQAESRFVRPLSSSIARSSAGSIQSEAREENEPDELEAVAPSSSVPASARKRIPTTITEEVTESPAQKPGSGRRRRIPSDDRSQPLPPSITISSSSARESPPSSPSTRRPRPGDRPARPAAPTAPSRPPTLPLRQGVPTQPRTTAPLPRSASPKRRQPSLDTVTEEESEPSDEEAVQVSAREASTVIGQKRPRPSTTTSTELGSDNSNSDNSEPNSTSQPSSYRQKRKSPATQRQPAKRSRQHSQQSQSRRKKRHSSSSEQNDDAAVEITVQRFVNNFQRDEDDELQQEIPYANRAGETVVDVFAQVCEEVISSVVDQLQRLAAETDDGDKKKECRIKMRAIEAYGEELSSRLLQHVIHLNHWHSLRRRLRHVQKEKLALRDEIIRLKGEREQVALRTDAIRMKHESDSTKCMSRLNASALMHDIDLAVQQGREAPELSQAAERTAELGNLDLVLAQISDQVSSVSSTGGLLQQVRDFNSFLERAANALESR
ncbi:hypothetical protein E4U13_000087 [Claviceps humidiphila]|uniref:Inner kinetochore subunit AME1 domain-containing protein n=1 Tax=Claviceps humidiphila TaxID=1294629 RepID=A0A9P7QCI3_9HYPO|nr:hypothetical protein E4U13_000087 [Claviceps humidiphila]